MDIPIKFPSESEVILEDVGRFRALGPLERIALLQRLLIADELKLRNSPDGGARARQQAEEEKNLERRAIREFLARHADRYCAGPETGH